MALKSPDSKWHDNFEAEMARLPTLEEDLPVTIPGGTENERHLQDLETPQTAEMRAMFERPSGAVYGESCLSDQEIRARALELTIAWWRNVAGTKIDESSPGFYATLDRFEDYIRNGR